MADRSATCPLRSEIKIENQKFAGKTVMAELDVLESETLQKLAHLRSQVPARDPQLFPALQWLAKLYFDQHRYSEVRPLLDESLEIRIAALGEGH
jgi:hypothetical protein